MMRFAVCEDDTNDKRELVNALKAIKMFEVDIAEYSSGKELLESMQQEKNCYDLYFFDIEMPGMTGLELAKEIRKMDSGALFIFTTSHAKYQIEALNLIVLGYILKPVSKEIVANALNKAKPFIREKESIINISSNKFKCRVKAKDIIYIYALGRKKIVVTIDDEIETNMSIDEVLEQLPKAYFVQPHKSYIVNMYKISHIEGNEIILIDNTKIDMSRGMKKVFRDKYLEFLARIA